MTKKNDRQIGALFLTSLSELKKNEVIRSGFFQPPKFCYGGTLRRAWFRHRRFISIEKQA